MSTAEDGGIPRTAPAEWLSDKEELYFPEVSGDGDATVMRRVERGVDTFIGDVGSSRTRNESDDDGIEINDWNHSIRDQSSGNGGLTWGEADLIDIRSADPFRMQADGEYMVDEDLADVLAVPVPDRNLAAEAEVLRCGRKLTGA